jgi:uncharacterized protein YukJ
MPLASYGILVGTLVAHHRDTPDDQGRWFHVHLEVDAPAGRYRCAVDVDSKQSATGVQWRTLTVQPARLPMLSGLADGYRPLARDPESGALDYIRHPALRPGAGCLGVRPPGPARRLAALLRARSWHAGTNVQAATALEAVLIPGARIAILGEPFETGLGMHNIHQNQGDPPGSQWYPENGIWQDGGTVVYRPDGRYDVFLSKFTSQADTTDEQGHPRTGG